MEAPLFASGFLWGVLGGSFAELLQWFGLRHSVHAGVPDWSKSKIYWLITGLMILVGGGLVVAYVGSGLSVNPLMAINIGASAPLIIGKLAQQAPKIDPGKVG